jgi:hypothetical protein
MDAGIIQSRSGNQALTRCAALVAWCRSLASGESQILRLLHRQQFLGPGETPAVLYPVESFCRHSGILEEVRKARRLIVLCRLPDLFLAARENLSPRNGLERNGTS